MAGPNGASPLESFQCLRIADESIAKSVDVAVEREFNTLGVSLLTSELHPEQQPLSPETMGWAHWVKMSGFGNVEWMLALVAQEPVKPMQGPVQPIQEPVRPMQEQVQPVKPMKVWGILNAS